MRYIKSIGYLLCLSISISGNAQNTWTLSNTGLPSTFAINEFESVGGVLIAAGSNFIGSGYEARLYTSSNAGASWTQMATSGLSNLKTGNAIIRVDNRLLLSGALSNFEYLFTVFASTDNGKTWSVSNSGLPAEFNVLDFIQVGTDIYAAGSYTNINIPEISARVYKSTNGGASWVNVTGSGLPQLFNATAFEYFNKKMFFATYNYDNLSYLLYSSADNGKTWVAETSGLPGTFAINGFAPVGNVLYAAGSLRSGNGSISQLYKSSNGGTTWSPVNTIGLADLFTGNSLFLYGNKLFMSGAVSLQNQAYSLYASNVQVTPLREAPLETSYSVFPNPFTTELQISNVGIPDATAVLRDAQGRTWYRSVVTDSEHQPVVLPRGLPAGLYYLHIESKGRWSKPTSLVKVE